MVAGSQQSGVPRSQLGYYHSFFAGFQALFIAFGTARAISLGYPAVFCFSVFDTPMDVFRGSRKGYRFGFVVRQLPCFICEIVCHLVSRNLGVARDPLDKYPAKNFCPAIVGSVTYRLQCDLGLPSGTDY